VKDGARAIAFYTRTFGAQELFRLTEPSGKVGHAKLSIGDSCMSQAEFHGDRVGMIADPFGHEWRLASRREDVQPAEMQRRRTALFA